MVAITSSIGHEHFYWLYVTYITLQIKPGFGAGLISLDGYISLQKVQHKTSMYKLAVHP